MLCSGCTAWTSVTETTGSAWRGTSEWFQSGFDSSSDDNRNKKEYAPSSVPPPRRDVLPAPTRQLDDPEILQNLDDPYTLEVHLAPLENHMKRLDARMRHLYSPMGWRHLRKLYPDLLGPEERKPAIRGWNGVTYVCYSQLDRERLDTCVVSQDTTREARLQILSLAPKIDMDWGSGPFAVRENRLEVVAIDNELHKESERMFFLGHPAFTVRYLHRLGLAIQYSENSPQGRERLLERAHRFMEEFIALLDRLGPVGVTALNEASMALRHPNPHIAAGLPLPPDTSIPPRWTTVPPPNTAP
jgi:hypothetical protein